MEHPGLFPTQAATCARHAAALASYCDSSAAARTSTAAVSTPAVSTATAAARADVGPRCTDMRSIGPASSPTLPVPPVRGREQAAAVVRPYRGRHMHVVPAERTRGGDLGCPCRQGGAAGGPQVRVHRSHSAGGHCFAPPRLVQLEDGQGIPHQGGHQEGRHHSATFFCLGCAAARTLTKAPCRPVVDAPTAPRPYDEMRPDQHGAPHPSGPAPAASLSTAPSPKSCTGPGRTPPADDDPRLNPESPRTPPHLA